MEMERDFCTLLGRRKRKDHCGHGPCSPGAGTGKTGGHRAVPARGAAAARSPLLEQLGAKIYRGKAGQKFVFQMNDAEKAAAREVQNANLAAANGAEPADLLILDEAGSAWELDMVDKDLLRQTVLERPAAQECVLTAHTAPAWMLDAADYSTEMKCHRHPYQKGIKARRGIEY